MNIYELTRNFWDWSFNNPEKIKPNHIAVYFFAIEHCNRLGWKEKFGFPTSMVMDAISIKNYRTFINTLNDLVDYGFIEMIEKSKNQYSSNIIALVKNTKANTKAHTKALDKAIQKHSTKHSQKQVQSTYQSIDSIDIQLYNNTNLPKDNETMPIGSHIDFDKLLSFINKKTGRNLKTINDNVRKKYRARLKEGYTKEDILNAITNASQNEYHVKTKCQYLTAEFFSRSETLEKYSNIEIVKPQKTVRPAGVWDV